MSYYIYGHYDGLELKYIGMGYEGRAWAVTGRKGEHKPFMASRLNDGDTSFVRILVKGLTQEDAKDMEELAIKTTQPPFNRFFTDAWKELNKERGLKGAEASSRPVRTPLGVFPSCAKAADAHGIKYRTLIGRVKSPSKNMEGYQYVAS